MPDHDHWNGVVWMDEKCGQWLVEWFIQSISQSQASTPKAGRHARTGGALLVLGLEEVEGGEDEDGRLAHARLGLADDVHAQQRLRDALVLHCGKARRRRSGVVVVVW